MTETWDTAKEPSKTVYSVCINGQFHAVCKEVYDHFVLQEQAHALIRQAMRTTESLVIMPNDVEIGDHDARRRADQAIIDRARSKVGLPPEDAESEKMIGGSHE